MSTTKPSFSAASKGGAGRGPQGGRGAGKGDGGRFQRDGQRDGKPVAEGRGRDDGRGHGGGRGRDHRGGRSGGRTPEVAVRGRTDAYWIYGWHAVLAALANPKRSFLRAWVTESAREKLAGVALPPGLSFEVVPGEVLDRAVGGYSKDGTVPHQGVGVEVRYLSDRGMEVVVEDAAKGPILLLDQVTDPHNVGAILRSAAAFDAKGIITTSRNSSPESGALAKAAAGALELVPLVKVANLVQAMLALKSLGYWCVGMDADAPQTMREYDKPEKIALVFGAEGRGLRRLTAEHCDVVVRLPMSGRMESLNVSNAAAIAMYECFSR